MKKMKTIYLVLILLLGFGYTNAQDLNSYQKDSFILAKDTLKYRILYPENMEKGVKYPLVLFLHGSGERGTDNQKQLTHGASLFLDENIRKTFPAIVIFPQCPPDIKWTHRLKEKSTEGDWIFKFPTESGPTKPAYMVDQLVNKIVQKENIDPKRVYIMGLSMGGIGTLEFLYRWPDKYTAAVVICGGHKPELATKYASIPIWFFHGGEDDVVPCKYSQRVYEEQKKYNTESKYTLYPKANHNSWDQTFAEPDLLKWLFSKSK
jgi:predicted peptidase